MEGAQSGAEAVARERAAFVDLIGSDIGEIWRSVTRVGGQCVAALYLADEPRSMDDLAAELGRSKSNIFTNLRALEALGLVRRVRVAGSTKDYYGLSGAYPDVLVEAFLRNLGRKLYEKSSQVSELATNLRATMAGSDDEAVGPLIDRMERVSEFYGVAAQLIDGLLPRGAEPATIAGMLKRITPSLVTATAKLVARGVGHKTK